MASRSITIFNHQLQYQSWGESALRFWDKQNDSSLNLPKIAEAILQSNLKSVTDIISSEEEMLIITKSTTALMENLTVLSNSNIAQKPVKIFRLPVFINPEPEFNGDITNEDLIQELKSSSLSLSMFGFIPGFIYFSGLSPKLHLPRKETPSLSCPEGSLAIGGTYFGIYNFSSPAGWHIIGQTPVSIPIASQDICINDTLDLEFIDEERFKKLKEQTIDILSYNAQS